MNNNPHNQNTRLAFLVAFSIILLTIWSSINVKDKIDSGSIDQDNKEQKTGSAKIAGNFSQGENILIAADNTLEKQYAVDQFAAGDFQTAQMQFKKSLEVLGNDPEALIYLNNSVAVRTDDSITIGVSVPIGGSLDVAQEILRGVAHAQNEVNKEGGITQKGIKRLVKIVIANDDNDPEIAEDIADKFVQNSSIIGVVGHNSSNVSISAAPVYQNGGLVMISPTSSAKELSRAGSYIFRTTPNTRILAETLAQYVVDNIDQKEIVICSDSNSRGSTSFQDDFSLALLEMGGSASNIECDFSDDRFNPEFISSQAIDDDAGAILLIPSVNKINQALDVARSNGKKGLPLLGSHSMYTYETLKIGQADLNGMVFPAAWHPKITANSDFNQTSLELWGSEGTWRTATAYDATKAIFKGIELADTRQELQVNLASSGYFAPGALGKISFKNSGDREIKAALIKVQAGKKSSTGYDFFPISNF